MPFLIILIFVLVVVLCFAPGAWFKSVEQQHAPDRPDFARTGGELARHLLDLAGLDHVRVEVTKWHNYYDPSRKTVWLTHDIKRGRSLTAMATAAHEVGHALQHRDGSWLLIASDKIALIHVLATRIAWMLVASSPMALFIWPQLARLQIGAALLSTGIGAILHLVTLTVEFDASFGKALPTLDRGNHVPKADLAAARKILRAAAWTYVAAALRSFIFAAALFLLIDIFRWFWPSA
ncbi:MAG: zinc metallopeptidase [Rhizobiales bacterium]|nr:zinc metallopeptidase [Hyphomicrobiales bacterium]